MAGSFSRTAVNYAAGCESLISNIVMAITVMISLQFLTNLLYYTPIAIIASVIISALPGLIDIAEAHKIWKVDKLDFLACIGAFFGVLFASVEIGLLVAVKSFTLLDQFITSFAIIHKNEFSFYYFVIFCFVLTVGFSKKECLI
jgi:low affinity sulfate transporter 2